MSITRRGFLKVLASLPIVGAGLLSEEQKIAKAATSGQDMSGFGVIIDEQGRVRRANQLLMMHSSTHAHRWVNDENCTRRLRGGWVYVQRRTKVPWWRSSNRRG